MFRTHSCGWDIVAIVSVLLVAVLLLLVPVFAMQEGQFLQIVTERDTYRYELSEDRVIELHENGISLTVVIENGAAYVRHSDCPDGVCLASGSISRSGESILCAPAGVTLTVKGGGGDVDFVAG
jgi:hypothetical protein